MPGPALLLLTIALASPTAAPGEPQGEAGRKRICRPAAAPLGSRIKRARVCRTAAEWEEQEAASRAAPIPVKPAQPEPWQRARPQ